MNATEYLEECTGQHFEYANDIITVETATKAMESYAKEKVLEILDIIQKDPHLWSKRPCESCRTISNMVGQPIGCYRYQKKFSTPTGAENKEEEGGKE